MELKFNRLNISIIFLYFINFIISTVAIRHARNLIWTQTPSLKTGVSRIVGIEGDPSVWVPSGNVQVRHISAPHMGWQFRALAFNYNDQSLYWTEAANKKIQGLRLNGTTETETIFTGTSSMAEGLAVDWLSNNVYWSDSLYDWIIMSPRNSVEPVFKTIVRSGLSNPHSLAVHPQKGYLFWTDWGTVSKIEVSDLLGQNRRVLINDDLGHPKGLVIDFADQVLYWVDSQKDTIESAEFNGNNRRLVAYQSGTLFYGIAVYKNYLFVTEQVQGHLRVYDKKTGNNEINYQLGYVPDGIVMYDESCQPGNSSSCDDAGCEHICVNDPLAGPICRCGEGFTLQDDGVSCKVNKKFGQPSHMYSIRDAICQYPINLPDMSLYNITLESQCFMQNGRGHFGLTFDAREHMLYYSENVTGSIGRINLQLGETGDLILKGVGEVQGLALDWVAGNLYWTDKTYRHISMSRKDGLYPTVIVEDLWEPVGIAVHPERGKIFWADRDSVDPKIEMANMDGSQRQVIVNSTWCGEPNHLYLDYVNNRLYWADSGLYSVRCVDLDTLETTVIYENVRQRVTFYGISLYQDYLLWTDNNDMKNGVHAARLDKLEKVRGIIHPHAGFASDLITFDIQNQPDMKSPCGNNNGFCEQLCIPTSNISKICACGTGYDLDDNLRTCSSRVSTDNYLITADSYHRQLYQIEIDSGNVHAIPLTKAYKGVAVDINPITNKVYWTDNQDGAIMTAGIDGFGESIFRRLPNGSVCDGIAVDYVNQLLFYTETSYNIIVVVSLNNPDIYRTIVNDTLDEPRDIIVDSLNGKIYWSDWGWEPKIEAATMDGGNRSLLMRLDNGSWPNALTLDTDSNTLYWLDAKAEVIGQINLDTREKKIIYSEPRAHFFGMAMLGQYLYVTDWFRKNVGRLPKTGGPMERVGPQKFSRLNGIAAYKKDNIKIVMSKCLSSPCSHLCLPVSRKHYRCACSDEGKRAVIPCREMNTIDNEIIVKPKASRIQENNPGPRVGLVIGMVVLGLVIASVIGFVAIFIYKKYRSEDIPHDKLVEDTRVDSFYRITFPDTSQEEANFDSGIENPSFTASAEDIRTSGNVVHYSPL